jgi:hypothetical protein
MATTLHLQQTLPGSAKTDTSQVARAGHRNRVLLSALQAHELLPGVHRVAVLSAARTARPGSTRRGCHQSAGHETVYLLWISVEWRRGACPRSDLYTLLRARAKQVAHEQAELLADCRRGSARGPLWAPARHARRAQSAPPVPRHVPRHVPPREPGSAVSAHLHRPDPTHHLAVRMSDWILPGSRQTLLDSPVCPSLLKMPSVANFDSWPHILVVSHSGHMRRPVAAPAGAQKRAARGAR